MHEIPALITQPGQTSSYELSRLHVRIHPGKKLMMHQHYNLLIRALFDAVQCQKRLENWKKLI